MPGGSRRLRSHSLLSLDLRFVGNIMAATPPDRFLTPHAQHASLVPRIFFSAISLEIERNWLHYDEEGFSPPNCLPCFHISVHALSCTVEIDYTNSSKTYCDISKFYRKKGVGALCGLLINPRTDGVWANFAPMREGGWYPPPLPRRSPELCVLARIQ